jgi:hypothetical protein
VAQSLGWFVAERLGWMFLRKVESPVLIDGKLASIGSIRGSGAARTIGSPDDKLND